MHSQSPIPQCHVQTMSVSSAAEGCWICRLSQLSKLDGRRSESFRAIVTMFTLYCALPQTMVTARLTLSVPPEAQLAHINRRERLHSIHDDISLLISMIKGILRGQMAMLRIPVPFLYKFFSTLQLSNHAVGYSELLSSIYLPQNDH
jgi:hypothetical protein